MKFRLSNGDMECVSTSRVGSRRLAHGMAGLDRSCLTVRSGRAAGCSSPDIPASKEAGSRCGWMRSAPR